MGGRARRKPAWGAVAALAAVVIGATAPAAGAAATGCRVKNVSQGSWFATTGGQALTQALEAAADGDRLHVFGRCVGRWSIDKDVSLWGTTNRRNRTVLDGAGTPGRSVLTVAERATVTLSRLTITGGNATTSVGGGIQTGGNLTLVSSTVVGNRAQLDGGGIYNYGNLTVVGSRITRNTSGGGGGGLFTEGVASLRSSVVTRNTAAFGGGILAGLNEFELVHTIVAGNTPDDCSC